MYERIARFVPANLRQKFRMQLDYLGIDIEETRFVGFLLAFSIALSLGLAVNLYLFFSIPWYLSWIGFAVFFFFGIYLYLSIAAEGKGKYVDKILPDALQLIASNIKAGLTTERALFVSARPEFGPLETELKMASKKILAGERTEEALLELPKKIRSKTLERTVWLISKGILSGGQIADLLIKLSDDLREQNALEEETKANISMYVLLIFFAAAFGAPLLFGVSTFIVEIMAEQTKAIPTIELGEISTSGTLQASGIGMLVGGERKPIDPGFAVIFASVIIFVGAVFSGLTMGIINAGREKEGVKYIPMIMLIAFGVFFAVRIGLLVMFGAML